ARTIMQAQGLRITVLGTENIPADGGAVLAMNHTGYYDFMLGGVPAYLRGKHMVRFMAKKEIFGNAFIAWLGKKMKHIPVDRSAGGSSINIAVEALHDGNLLGIFREATISRCFEIKVMKNGAAHCQCSRCSANSGGVLGFAADFPEGWSEKPGAFQDPHHHGGRRTNSYHRGCRERHRRRVLRHEIHDGAGTRALR